MPAAIHLVCGDDEFLVTAKAREIINRLLPADQQTLGLEVVDGRSDNADAAVGAVSKCLAALQTVGFFESRKVVWLRDAAFLESTGPGEQEAAKRKLKTSLDALARALKENVPDGAFLVVTAAGVDGRGAFFRFCKEHGQVSEYGVAGKTREGEQQAMQSLRDLTAKLGVRMSSRVMQLLLARVGSDTRRLVSELEKLLLYAGPGVEVTGEHVQQITSLSQSAEVWDLGDAVGRRDLGAALAVLRQLLFQRESHMRLIGDVERRLRDLLVIREALDRGWLRERPGYGGNSEVAWTALPPAVEKWFSGEKGLRKMHPYRLSLLAAQARNFSLQGLRSRLALAVKTHEGFVSGASRDPVLALEFLLGRILAREPTPQHASRPVLSP